jgi:hypothetical protein
MIKKDLAFIKSTPEKQKKNLSKISLMFGLFFMIASLGTKITFQIEIHEAILLMSLSGATVAIFFAIGLAGNITSKICTAFVYLVAGMAIGSMSDVHNGGLFLN